MKAIFIILLFIVNPFSLVLARIQGFEKSTKQEFKEPDTPLPTQKTIFYQSTETEPSHSESKEPEAPLPTPKASFDQTTGTEPSHSDSKWVDIGTNTVYYIERNEMVNWYRAIQTCKTMGIRSFGKEARLAIFKSADEIHDLRTKYRAMRIHVPLWIGTPREAKGPFKRTDKEDCTALITDRTLWENIPCKFSMFFICAADKEPKEPDAQLSTQQAIFDQTTEKEPSPSEPEASEAPLPTEITSFELTTKKEPSIPVPQWVDIGTNSVYYIEGKAEVTWFHAAWVCALMGLERTGKEGRLANFESLSDLLFLKKHLKNLQSPLWFGLSKRDARSFVWMDEKPTTYTYWDVYQPDNYEKKEDCVEIRPSTMKWNDQDCKIKRLFICASDKVELPDCGPNLKDWKLYKDNCYLIRSRHEDALDWMSAEQYCVNRKAHLVSMMDQKEDYFVSHQVFEQLLAQPKSLHSFWLGLKVVGNSSVSTWTDGSSINYMRTDINPDSGECVFFNLLLGQWKSIPCSRKMGVICKAPYALLNSSSELVNDCSGTAETTIEVENRTDVATGGLMAVVIVEIILSLLMLLVLLYFLIKRWKVHKSLSTWVQDKVHIRWMKNLNDSVINNSLI